jgi:hypothetical protein
MQRFRDYELILGALLMLAAVAVALALNAAVPPDASNWSWGLFKDAAGFFALCAVFVAAVQAVLFVRQLKLMRETIDTANRTLQLSARTWVFAGPIPQTIREVDGELRFTMRAINYGKTPAIVTDLVVGCLRNPPIGAVNYDGLTPFQTSFPLGPDRDHFNFDDEIRTPTDFAIVYGFVGYEVAEVRHTSRFCYRIASRAQGWTLVNVGGPDWHRFD